MKSVTPGEIGRAARTLELSGRPICVHSSLRSFGRVSGGARTIVDALLAERCTLLVPTFTMAAYQVWPDPPDAIERNALPRHAPGSWTPGWVRPYAPETDDIDRDMGAIPAAVLETTGRARGDHPLNSFTAVGPLAVELIEAQRPRHVYAPLEALADLGGRVVLSGVGYDRMTLLHLAERRAGRSLFVRWALDRDGELIRAEVGGCSEGFPKFASVLDPIVVRARVGASDWRVLDAAAALDAATVAIRADPSITRCDDSGCLRCRNAALGGPLEES